MTDKAPERIWGILTKDDESPHWFGNLWSVQCSEDDVAWVPADLLDAANARIADLEDKLGLERALSDGAHRRARNARAEALEEAAKVADHFRDSCGECHWPEEAVIVGGNVANDIAAAIRALKGGSNG